MAFPTSPANEQQATVNGITYTYNSTDSAWYRTGTTLTANITGNTVSTSTTTGALTVAGGVGIVGNVYAGNVYAGNFFYANGTAISSGSGSTGYTGSAGTGYTGSAGTAGSAGYTGSSGSFSGTTSSAIVTTNTTTSTSTSTGALQVAGGAGIAGNLNVGGTAYFTGDLLPTANNTINIGSASNRFGTLYLSANTIDLGGTTITTAPNGELIFTTSAGNVSLTANTINFLSTVANTSNNQGDMNIAGNLTVDKIYANSYFYSNGTALTSGTATSNGSSVYGNFDGGFPDSVHGGITSIDAGSIV